MFATQLLTIILIAYLIGSIPFSIIVSRIFAGIDIREHGSGNAGGTNVGRILGWKLGLFVIFLDIMKGVCVCIFIVQMIPVHVHSEMSALVRLSAGFSAVIGHIWPIFVGFKGGKGVGTLAGVLMVLNPIVLGVSLIVFIIILMKTRIMSMASMGAAISIPFINCFCVWGAVYDTTITFIVISFLIPPLIIYTHKSNLKKIIHGKENRLF